MKKNDWKRREGVVFSTNPEFSFQEQHGPVTETLPPHQQRLTIFLDKSGRAGKQVSVVSGFVGTQADLDTLAKLLKTKCGVGGACKEGEILIQGDVRDKLVQILSQANYKAKRSGG